MKNILLIIIFTSPIHLFAQSDHAKDRFDILEKFVDDLRKDSITNKDIMKRYVIEGYYFKVDSIGVMADRWINNALRKLVQEDIEIIKYSDHEKDFIVYDNPPGRPLSPRTKQKLKFSLSTLEHEELPVDINDLYVLRLKNSKSEGLFILFDDKNKIISFSSIQYDSLVGLWQY